ncbi:MAG: TIGR00730 family Rossman fold protein [Candidatus Dormibacteria bacterium]
MRVCVFMGARDGNDPHDRALAEDLGREIGERGWTLVFGGAGVGLMGRVAHACLEAGGRVIGITPGAITAVEGEVLPDGRLLSEVAILKRVRSMERRKAEMMDLAQGYVVLPGGAGTFAEAWPVLDAAKLQRAGMHPGWRRPLVFLAGDDYFAGTMQQIESGIKRGFFPEDFRQLFRESHTATDALNRLDGFHATFRPVRVRTLSRTPTPPVGPTVEITGVVVDPLGPMAKPPPGRPGTGDPGLAR